MLRSPSSAQFFQTLLDLLVKCENNPLSLLWSNCCDDPLQKDTDIFTRLAGIALNTPKKDRKLRKSVAGVLNSLVRKWVPRKHHFDAVLSRLNTFLVQNDSEGIVRTFKILRILCRENAEQEAVPNYFFFSPLVSGIALASGDQAPRWEFAKGYTAFFWVKLEDLQTLQRGGQNVVPTLVRLKVGGKGVEYYFNGLKLVCRVDQGKEVEIGTLLTNTWYGIGISHSPSKQLRVVINNEAKQMLAEFPKIPENSLLEEAKICENFAGQLSSVVVYKAALSKEQLLETVVKFPYGIGETEAYQEVAHLPQGEVWVGLSPVRGEVKGKLYDLHGGVVVGTLYGNSGIVQLPTPSFGPRCPLTLSDLFPVLNHLKSLKDPQKVFHKWVLTAKTYLRYLSVYEKSTVKATHEYKQFATILGLHLTSGSFNTGASSQVLTEIEEIASFHVTLEKRVIRMLVDSASYWTGSDSETVEKYWGVMKSHSTGLEPSAFSQFLTAMTDLSTKSDRKCCQDMVEQGKPHDSLSVRYEPFMDVIQSVIPKLVDVRAAVKEVLQMGTRKEVSHCLFTQGMILLGKIAEIHGMETTVDNYWYEKLLETAENFPFETRLDCVEVIKKLIGKNSPQNWGIEKLYRAMYASVVKKVEAAESGREQPVQEEEGKRETGGQEAAENFPSVESEQTDEEHNISLLQEKVMSEEANINSTIKKIKQIKIDIQETNKSNSNSKPNHTKDPDSKVKKNLFFEDFELSGTAEVESVTTNKPSPGNHILSIEELVAQDPYKPPPAPKNEKMKQKRFIFGASEENAAEEPVKPAPTKKPIIPKLQIPSTKKPMLVIDDNADESTVPKKPKTFGLILGGKNPKQLLAIDTETINKEFDIGGEKGKKLVDETEEEERYEQEILELAEHCVIAMARHSPSEQIISRYANMGGSKSPAAGFSVPITATHKSTLMQPQKVGLAFPQSTKERKQFTFCLDNIEAGAATPIKEESLMTSKSSLGRDTVHIESEPAAPVSDSSETFCSLLVAELVGKEWKHETLPNMVAESVKGEIVVPEIAPLLLKVARKVPSLLMPVTEFCLKLAENSTENKKKLAASVGVHKTLLKIEVELYVAMSEGENKANKVVEYEQVITLHSLLIAATVTDPTAACEFQQTLIQWIAGMVHQGTTEPRLVSDTVKYLWGKALVESKLLVGGSGIRPPPGISRLAEGVFKTFVLLNETNKDTAVSFTPTAARSAPVVLYSDTELLKLLFELLGGVFWKSACFGEIFGDAVSQAEFAELFDSVPLEILNEQLEAFVAGHEMAFLICLALRNSAGVTELEYWTTEGEEFLKYALLLLESSKTKAASPQLENAVLLLLGNLMQGCCDPVAPDEHHQFYAKTVAHVFQFVFELVRLPDSKTKGFYESQLSTKEGRCLVPIEEINLTEGVTMAELMRILTPEYPQLLEHNPGIIEQIQMVSKPYLDTLKKTLLNPVSAPPPLPPTESPIEEPFAAPLEKIMDLVSTHKKWHRLQKSRTLRTSFENPPRWTSHQFENGVRAVFVPKTSIESSLPFPTWIVDFIKFHPDYPMMIANRWLDKIPEKLRKKLPPPLPACVSSGFRKAEGVVVIRKNHCPTLIFIRPNIEIPLRKWCKKWKLADIRQLFRRGKTDLEITFYGGRSATFTFDSPEDRDLLGTKLVRLRGKWCKYLKYVGTMDPVKVFEKEGWTQKWARGTISTVDYLLAVNRFAGNSFNSAKGYPVLPFPSGKTGEIQVEKYWSRVWERFGGSGSGETLCGPEVYSVPLGLLDSELGKERTGDQYGEIVKRRAALEENGAGSAITSWIDKVFGSSAEKSDSIRVQIFRSPHQTKSGPSMTLWDRESVAQIRLLSGAGGPEIVHIQPLTNQPEFMLFSRDGNIQVVKTDAGPKLTSFAHYEMGLELAGNCSWEKTGKSCQMRYFSRGKIQYVAQGGYLNGSLQLSPIFSPGRPTISLHYHFAEVTAIGVDSEERIGITGTKSGDCTVFALGEDMFWNPKCVLKDHGTEITSIAVSNEMQLFATGSTEGKICVYSLKESPSIVSSLKICGEKSFAENSSIILAMEPIPCVAVSTGGTKINVWSLTGDHLSEVSEKVTTEICVAKNGLFESCVIYGRDDYLVARKLPYLEEQAVIKCDQRIVKVAIQKDAAVVAFEDGSVGYVFNHTES